MQYGLIPLTDFAAACHAHGVPVIVDGYSGAIIRAKRRKTVAEIDAASLQVPDAAIGVGVLIVLGLVILALVLWVLRHLYWY